MKAGDKIFIVFQDYKIVRVTVRNIPETREGAYVLRKGELPNEAYYFQNKWLFKTRIEAIRNCMKRLRLKMENNVKFYNALNTQIADATLEEMDLWKEEILLDEKKVLDRGYF